MEPAQQLIDLSYLTEEERGRLEAVIKADEELRVRDRIRLGTIRQEIQQQRTHQAQFDGLPQCSICEARLGRIFNSGAYCPICGHKVCKRCRVIQADPPPKFICSVCERQRLLDLQSNDYNINTTLTVLPHHTPPTQQLSHTPTPSPQHVKQDVEGGHLYGSELIRQSLMAVSPEASQSPSPLPDKKPSSAVDIPNPRSSISGSLGGSVTSAIVVRYTERDGSVGERSVKSLSSGKEDSEMAVHPARKIALDELPEIEEEEGGEMNGKHDPRKRSSLGSSLVPSGSIGSLNSITSMYSASIGKGNYDITGDIELGVWFKNGQLFVRVVRAKGLAAAKKGGVSDPYVKTYLLPDRGKQSKRKTGVQRKTVHPVFNEILKTKIEQHELSSRTLWLSVWDWDRFGRNQFLGEVRLPLSSLDLTDSRDRWYSLLDKDESALQDDFYKGKLLVGLMYEPKAKLRSSTRAATRTIGTLHVAICQAEDLPVMDEHGLTDATVKTYLLPNQSSSGKRKTKVVKNSLSPAWNEKFTYENICLEDLEAGRVLEVTVWDYDRRGSNDFIGGLRLGSRPDSSLSHGKPKDWMDSIGDEVTQWETMLERPGEWAEQWHVLRPSMEPLSKLHPLPTASPKHRKKELSPVQELSPTHEIEESSSPPVMEGFAFSLPATPKRSADSSPNKQPPAEAFKQATPLAAEDLLLEEEEEEEEERREEGGRGVVRAATYEFTAADERGEATPPSRETTSTPEIIVTPEPIEEESSKDTLKDDWFGSTGSLHNKGDYDITGEVLVGVYYHGNQLHVHVDRARGLAAADSNGYSDPYVKSYLLPDKAKHTKQKTSIKKKTLNPVYNETLKYKFSESELSSRTLWLSVWDWDRFGKNQFLGEVRLPLSSLDLTDRSDCWYSLLDKDDGSQTSLQKSTTSLKRDQPVEGDSSRKQKSVPPSSHSPSAIAKPAADISKTTEADPPGVSSSTTRPTGPPSDASSQAEASGEAVSKTVHIKSEEVAKVESKSSAELEAEVSSEAGITQVVESSAPESKIPLSQIHHDYQGLPHKKHSSLARLKHTSEGSSLSGSVSSFGSMTSIYSEAGGKGDYDITGEMLVGVYYHGNQLHVHVDRARGLAAANSNGYSDPYVKSYLLPDKAKHTKQKTSIKKKTLDPVYNEILKHKVSKSELSSRTLWLSVWDWDRFGRNQFLGEVRLPLSSLDLTDSTSQWYTLQDKEEGVAGGEDPFYRGELRVGLRYQPSDASNKRGTLIVDIKQAKDLPAMDGDSHTDSAVKLHLLPNRKSSGKRKTGVIKNNLNPVWEERFTYEDISLDELSRDRVLEVSVWNYDKSGNRFIGGLRLGPAPGSSEKHKDWMDSIGDEVTHWEDMLAHPGKWAEHWHTLRTSLDPRKVDPQPSLSATVPHQSSPPPTVEAEVASFSPVLLEDEFKKTKSSSQVAHVEADTQSPVQASVESTAHETSTPESVATAEDEREHAGVDTKQPAIADEHVHSGEVTKRPAIADERESRHEHSPNSSPAASSKPVFSSSVRTRPSATHTQASALTRDTRKAEAPAPREDSHTSALPPDRHVKEEDTPVIKVEVEGERTPPRATSTPVGKNLDLSELSGYREESPESTGSHSYQATPPHPKVPGLLGLKAAGSVSSFGSMTSIYSEAGGKGDYDITGEMLVGVYYHGNQLHVHVDRARGLAAADSNGYSDPYVKSYLLPDKAKHTKQKTSIKKKTLDPVYNETLKYKFSESEVRARTLWLSVWDWDRFGRNLFLGEVRLPLANLDLTSTADQWYQLQDKDVESGADEMYKGQLKLSLMFSTEAHSKKGKNQGTLHIAVEQAKDFQEPVDSFVKLYLLPDKSSSGKRKTKIIKSSLSPAWEERFTYEKVKQDDLDASRVLEVTVWNFHKRSGNVFIGGLRLGPAPGSSEKHKDWMDSIGDEVTHWEDMLAHPGKWAEHWHTLRTTMNPRDILLH